MIPEVIHYCWFGPGPLPKRALKCIGSWRKYFPDYEIKKWNEDNFDVNIIPYTRDAYEAGKYAFVSDYARFWILYHYGGIYLDTDVEVIRSFGDILERGAFMGLEIAGEDHCAVNPGLGIAAEAGMDIYQEVLEGFGNMSFWSSEGVRNSYSMIPMVTDILKAKGLHGGRGVDDVAGITVYPPEFFNPLDDATGRLHKTLNTHSVHWYSKSWLPPEPAWKVTAKRMLRRMLGKEAAARIGSFKG